MAQFRHSYSAVTANFELESVLEDYFQKYPGGPFSRYEIVFRSENEHVDGEYSYIIVFTVNRETRKSHVNFYDFLKSHCVRENRAATLHPSNNILPRIGEHGQTFGSPGP